MLLITFDLPTVCFIKYFLTHKILNTGNTDTYSWCSISTYCYIQTKLPFEPKKSIFHWFICEWMKHPLSSIPTVLTWLSRPRKMSIMKNRQAQRGDRGIIVTALGYAINARPGPASQNKSQTGLFLEHNSMKVFSVTEFLSFYFFNVLCNQLIRGFITMYLTALYRQEP